MRRRCAQRTKPLQTVVVMREALEDLVRRGVITTGKNAHGETTYTIPDVEMARRLLRESEALQ